MEWFSKNFGMLMNFRENYQKNFREIRRKFLIKSGKIMEKIWENNEVIILS